MDCLRNGLVCCRIWSPALGHWRILPTDLAVSQLTEGDVLLTLGSIVVLYSIFVAIEMWLMVRYARKGPSSLQTGRYDLETGIAQEA